jgi:hypothetical protein
MLWDCVCNTSLTACAIADDKIPGSTRLAKDGSSSAGERKVLSPEDFRQFPLTKVMPISYNTAMYASAI